MRLAVVQVEDTDGLIRMETIKLDIVRYNFSDDRLDEESEKNEARL